MISKRKAKLIVHDKPKDDKIFVCKRMETTIPSSVRAMWKKGQL